MDSHFLLLNTVDTNMNQPKAWIAMCEESRERFDIHIFGRNGCILHYNSNVKSEDNCLYEY